MSGRATPAEAALLLAILERKNNVSHNEVLRLALVAGIQEPERALKTLLSRRWVLYAMSMKGGTYGISDAGHEAAKECLRLAVAEVLVLAGVVKDAARIEVTWRVR